MAKAPAKPAKLNESLINEYMGEVEKLEAAQAAVKPLADKVKSLKEQIDTAFLALGKEKKKLGQWILSLFTKRGSVSWKTELTKRVTSEELAAIEASVPDKFVVEVQPA
jgi:peptidoglycan hydrolase CwlO-like protein